MRQLILIILIMCPIMSFIACREESVLSAFPPLVKSRDAHEEFKEHCEKYDYTYHVRKWSELEDKRLDYDNDEWMILDSFVRKYPNTTTTLSAKILMAMIKDNSPKIRVEAIAILEKIILKYPDSWQSTYAMWLRGQMYYSNAPFNRNEVHKVIKYHLQNLELYKKLDEKTDPELWLVHHHVQRVWWKEPESFGAMTLSSIAAWYKRFPEDQDKVESLYERIIREYAGTFQASQARLKLDSLRKRKKDTTK